MFDTPHNPPEGRSLQRQMSHVSHLRKHGIHQFRVDRVLAILADDQLATAAALNLNSQDGLRFECNFADAVFEDVRIRHRVRQLEEQGIQVSLIRHQHEVAGRSFERTQIEVRF